jgi:hypothetical protein
MNIGREQTPASNYKDFATLEVFPSGKQKLYVDPLAYTPPREDDLREIGVFPQAVFSLRGFRPGNVKIIK